MVDCPDCGATMRLVNGVYVCKSCGLEIEEDDFHKISIYGDDDFDDDIPEGCAACGGDYPNCAESCPMFD